MRKFIYTLKQILPLTYYSKYKVQNGVKELAICGLVNHLILSDIL